MRPACCVVAAVMAVNCLPNALLAQDSPTRVVVAIRPTGSTMADRLTLDTLAKYLEPVRVVVAEGETIAGVLHRFCGTAKTAHVEKFLEMNPEVNRGALQPGQSVVVPPCPYWSPDLRLRPSQVPLADQVLHVMGTAGSRTLAKVRRDNPILANWHASRDRLPAITLNYGMLPASFAVKERYAPAWALKALSGVPGLLGVDLDTHVEQMRPVTPADTKQNCRRESQEDWPYSHTEVLNVLRRNELLFGHVKSRPVRKVIIGIADTGIEIGENRLPLYETEIEKMGGEDEDRDGNDYFHDVIGTVLEERRGFPMADAGYEHGAHGIGVAALAVGGLVPQALLDEIRQRTAIRVLAYLRPQDAPGSASYKIQLSTLLQAIGYLPDNQIMAVLNLSVQTSLPIEMFKQRAEAAATLIVLAAGNYGEHVEEGPTYPAAYGSANILTVAAHDQISEAQWQVIRSNPFLVPPFNVLSNFSNHGGEVDLAAPGCRVPTMASNGGFDEPTGTSFAAPLVSFTAALLMSEGISSPARVRDRILASVDIVPGLRVFSSGVLNIPKALNVFEDQIETTDGQWLRGRIQEDAFELNGTSYDMKRVLKIVPRTSQGVRVFLTGAQGLRIENGATSNTVFTIRETEAQHSRTVPLSQIRDVVTAAQAYWGVAPRRPGTR